MTADLGTAAMDALDEAPDVVTEPLIPAVAYRFRGAQMDATDAPPPLGTRLRFTVVGTVVSHEEEIRRDGERRTTAKIQVDEVELLGEAT